MPRKLLVLEGRCWFVCVLISLGISCWVRCLAKLISFARIAQGFCSSFVVTSCCIQQDVIIISLRNVDPLRYRICFLTTVSNMGRLTPRWIAFLPHRDHDAPNRLGCSGELSSTERMALVEKAGASSRELADIAEVKLSLERWDETDNVFFLLNPLRL